MLWVTWCRSECCVPSELDFETAGVPCTEPKMLLLFCTFWYANPTVLFIFISTLASVPGMFKIQFVNLVINKIPQFCQQFTKPTLASISWINMLPYLVTLPLMTSLFANFSYLQLTKHVAMFWWQFCSPFLTNDKNCQFWQLTIIANFGNRQHLPILVSCNLTEDGIN